MTMKAGGDMLDHMPEIMAFALEKERNAERFCRKWAIQARPWP